MFKKFLSLILAFLLAGGSFLNAGGNMSLDDIKIMLSKPKTYVKEPEALLAMSVLAGMPQYDRIIKEFIALEEEIATKEALLANKQNARIIKAGKNMMIEIEKGFSLNFPALDDHYKWQKANVYEPAFEEVKKHRLAYLEYYKSPEIQARWKSAEKEFAAVEKKFKGLERQWNSARNTLLKAVLPADEAALKKEITSLKRSLTSKRDLFAAAQYQVFKEEYTSLMIRLREKAGLFLPEELEKFVRRMDTDLLRFERAASAEDIAFARRTLKQSLEKFGGMSVGFGSREIKFYKENLNRFFKNLSKRLSFKSSIPMIAAGGVVVFMLSAQSAQASEVSNRRVLAARALDYSFKETPELMLANTVALQDMYGGELVADVIYENQEYVPLLTKQSEALKFISENASKESDMISDIVVSSSDFQLPATFDFGF